jgi:hypothetical protein
LRSPPPCPRAAARREKPALTGAAGRRDPFAGSSFVVGNGRETAGHPSVCST